MAKKLSTVNCQLSTNHGFTLFEVMITILIATVGFVSLLQAISTGLFTSGSYQSELIAVTLCQQKAEQLRNTAFTGIANEAKAVVTGFTGFQREVAVTAVQNGLKQVDVKTYWFAKETEMNVALATYISDI